MTDEKQNNETPETPDEALEGAAEEPEAESVSEEVEVEEPAAEGPGDSAESPPEKPKAEKKAERQVSIWFFLSIVGSIGAIGAYVAFPITSGDSGSVRLNNLFLGLGAGLGLVLWWMGHETAGKTLVLFATGSMVAAATVLVTSGRRYLRAALTQGTLPLLGFVTMLFA